MDTAKTLRGRARGALTLSRQAAIGAAVCVVLPAMVLANSLGYVHLRYVNVSPRQAAYTCQNGDWSGPWYTGVYNLQLCSDPVSYSGPEAQDLVDGSNNYMIGTFCADLNQSASGSFLRYDIHLPQDAPIGGGNTPMGDAKAWDLRRLFDQHLGELDYPYDDLSDSDAAAAFQACVWEIIYEDPEADKYDMTADDFRMVEYWGSGWLSTANDWLDALGSDYPDIGLRVLTNEDTQDYAITVPGLGAVPICEPLTALAVCLGFGAVAGYARRRRAG